MRAAKKSVHERLFRLVLRLYPTEFRLRWGDEMAELFRARLARCDRPRRRLGLWWRILADAVTNAAAVRRARQSGKGRGSGDMGTLLRDVRYAARRLRRAPLFTLSAVALLAVGIGANTAAFTVVDSFLLRPPPWTEPERVVAVYQDSDDGEPGGNAFPAYRDMARSEVFSAVLATSASSAILEGPDGPLTVSLEFATSSYLDVFGLPPVMGRWFAPEHDRVGAEPLAVVSHAAWRSRFGSDPSVVGRTVRLNGRPVTIVGVGPAELTGNFRPLVTDFWLSISAVALGGSFRVENLERRQDHWYEVKARLAPGVSLEQARAAMDALALRMGEEYPDLDRGRGITVLRASEVRLHPTEDGKFFSAAGLLMGVVGLVLLLACGNLGNLLLVRGIGRSGEVAVRRALGASPGRVARLFLLEALLLSGLGGGLGILLARWAVSVLPRLPLPLPEAAVLDVGMDGRVLLFSTALMGVTGVLFGLAPAIRSARTDVAGRLRDESRTSTGGRGLARLRSALVALQVAVSVVLVLGAGLVGRSLAALRSVDTGVDADRVAFLRTNPAQGGLSGAEARIALEQLRERVASLPGVSSAAFTTRLPAQPSGSTTTVVEGYEPQSGTGAVELDFAIVTPEYFETVGLALEEGRGFGPDDVPDAQTVVVINRAAAERFWGGSDPLGRRMRPQGNETAWRTVIGVVEDAPVSRLGEPMRPMFYFSAAQVGAPAGYLVARTDGDPASLIGAMRAELRAVGSSLPVLAQGTLREHLGSGLAGPRFAAAAMGAFSLLALMLASLGIYAVVAFTVTGRSAELGIRMALGADHPGLVRMVVGEVVGTVILGLVAGLALALVAMPRVGGLLFGVEPLDPATFAGTLTLLLVVSGVAAWIPARRAAGLEAVESLRS